MTGWVAMVPGTLRDGACRCTEVAGQARAVADGVDGLPEPDGLPPHVSGQLRAAAAQLRRSAASAGRQSAWLVHRSQKGLMADGPFGSVLDLTAPPLLSPWAMPRPPEKPLKVPDPRESLVDMLFGRDYVLPEEAANVVLENGVNPTRLLKVLGIGARGARRTRISKPPGGGLKGHEERGGHTIEKHVGKTEGDLRARLRREPNIPAASAFTNRERGDRQGQLEARLPREDGGPIEMIVPGEPDFAFSQVIGTGYHQDAFVDAESVEKIIDRYRKWSPLSIREASETGHRLLAEGHDDEEVGAILRRHGFWLLPEPIGFAGYTAFLEHLVGRLDGFLAALPPEAFVAPRSPPGRELTAAEHDALSALLTDNFGAPSEETYESLLSEWSAQRPATVLRDARSAAKALMDGPLLDEPMHETLEALGLGYDLWDHDRVGVVGFLEAISDELSRALGEPPEYEDDDED
jgi:hypothetical protein